MDHQLEDALNLESAMTSMDFDHSGPVVSQEDITLETSGHEVDIPMEFEQIEEQPMLMDTGNEEIIVTDFMNDQYTLQEYSIQDDQTIEASGSVQENVELNVMTSQSETMLDLNYEPAIISQCIPQAVNTTRKVITVKASQANRPVKKPEIAAATMPKQIAIAPKPPKLVQIPKTYGNQLPIAPKPVALVVNKNVGAKKTTVSGVLKGGVKSNTVLTQIGKQLVMVPASGAQKIKLMSSSSGSIQYVRANNEQQAQLISTKGIIGTNQQKPTLTQVILRPDNQSDQPAVITKLTQPATSTGNQKRFVMQPKSVPFTMARSKVVLTSPTRVPLKLPQKLALKSPQPKITQFTTQASSGATKKVVITSNPNQNVILKTTAPPKTAQVSKDGNVVVQAQRSQLHQINVPGKGIQYIRLITNSSPAPQKVAAKSTASHLALSSKNFVLTDGKGNLIQMSTEKMAGNQPPPLVITGNVGAKLTPMAAKPQKLVRIAPATMAPATPKVTVQQSTRPLQSLLAPLSPVEEPTSRVELDEVTLDQQQIATEPETETIEIEIDSNTQVEEDQIDSKAALRSLIDEATEPDNLSGVNIQEVEVDFERREDSDEDSSGAEQPESGHRPDDHPLIIIPSNFQGKHETQMRVTSDSSRLLNESNYSNVESNYSNVEANYSNVEANYSNMESNYIESEMVAPYSPRDNHGGGSENEVPETLPGVRPRKACNCTKSQCLKLYCDCFANGEFCNKCNCINCHNNLENEELRQKAIRACLIRNPNAFRPKIGKTKTGGPELIRRHTKGCNCKRSGCLKNYCECYEAKIACTAMCKCVGCRNVEETLERRRDALRRRAARPQPDPARRAAPHAAPHAAPLKQPCSFMTSEVIEAVCQCLIAAAAEGNADTEERLAEEPDPVRDVIEEFTRCLQDIIGASHQSGALSPMHQGQA